MSNKRIGANPCTQPTPVGNPLLELYKVQSFIEQELENRLNSCLDRSHPYIAQTVDALDSIGVAIRSLEAAK